MHILETITLTAGVLSGLNSVSVNETVIPSSADCYGYLSYLEEKNKNLETVTIEKSPPGVLSLEYVTSADKFTVIRKCHTVE